ncbi:uncharacterized protein LOC111125432 isoform X2 [Crassostrea virginica]|uniref:Uncharacterized protein LOC111125432 isoform X2 n=1 Tax=Crassostrea virginica TaxID=6565 RepID=A0A8B8DB94_CRAVI|nr:uncharacterized protein LOC111125432 isoform X2 [Crassostrea virginica]
MSNQNKDDKVHKYCIRLLFEDKNVLSKHSSEDVSTARNEFELLLEKTAHQTTTSLPPKSSEEIRTNRPEKLARDASIRRRTGIKKRLSMTVRKSRPEPSKPERSEPSPESKENQKLKHENEMLRLQVDELTTRLSKFASDKLTDGNPNFADLSDKNRPTKIGEKFGMVYDEEWSDAYEEIQSLLKLSDTEVYEVLLNIVIAGDRFCREVSQSQLSSIEKGMKEPMLRPQWFSDGKEYSVAELEASPNFTASLKKFAKDFRRGTAVASVVPLCTIFKDGKFKELRDWDVYKMESLNLYIDACIECLWLMNVQDPPMYITCLNKGDNYEPAHFNMFLVKGKEVEYTVWPAVFLHEGGPLVSKGYVKPKEQLQ